MSGDKQKIYINIEMNRKYLRFEFNITVIRDLTKTEYDN